MRDLLDWIAGGINIGRTPVSPDSTPAVRAGSAAGDFLNAFLLAPRWRRDDNLGDVARFLADTEFGEIAPR
jgi:hypothetical protein